MSIRISDEQRAVFAGLADVLVPHAQGMPAASEVGVHRKWLDRALGARPDFAPKLLEILSEAEGKDPEEEVQRLYESGSAGFGVLSMLTTGAYYLNPKIRKLIGYPGQKSTPPYPDEADYYLRDGILDPVIARGPIFRPAP
jgi:hypothetical protein